MNKPNEEQGKKFLWVTFLTFDFFNTVSQTQMSKQLVRHGYNVHLIGIKSKKVTVYNQRAQTELNEWGAEGKVIIEKRSVWSSVANDFEKYLKSLL